MARVDKLKAQDGNGPIAVDGDITGYNAYWFDTLMMRTLGPGSLMKIAADKSGSGWDDPAVLTWRRRSNSSPRATTSSTATVPASGRPNSRPGPVTRQACCTWGHGRRRETAAYAAISFPFDMFPFPETAAREASTRADFIGFAVPKKPRTARPHRSLLPS